MSKILTLGKLSHNDMALDGGRPGPNKAIMNVRGL